MVTFFDRGASGVRGAVIVHALSAKERIYGRSYLRAIINAGMGAGAAIAVVPLELNTRAGYLSVIAADAASFIIAGLLLLRLRPVGGDVRSAPPAKQRARTALADGDFLIITALYAILSLQFGILQIGIPLWVIRSTNAPQWTISGTLILNTALVITLQVRASRGTEDPSRAARRCAGSGVLLALGCAIYGMAEGVTAVAAVFVLLAGTILITLGEVLSSAAAWALSYDLADPRSYGSYQGVFNSGFSAGMLLSGVFITNTAIRFGWAGWLIPAAVFVVAGACFIPATRRVARRGATSSTAGPSTSRRLP